MVLLTLLLLILAPGVVGKAFAADIDTGLVAYYSFDGSDEDNSGNGWHAEFFAGSYDKSGNGLEIYVGGQLAGSYSYNVQSFDDFSNQTWFLGQSNWPWDPYFDGLIDEVRIYNRVLDPAAIDELATSCPLTSPDEKLAEIIGDIIALNLQNGISNSLDAKLQSALDALEDANANNDGAAINKLQAFINAVNAQRGKEVSEADADELIAAAQAVIDQLSGS